jgi:hypothetical protein
MDGVLADYQALRDLPVGQALGQEPEYVALSPRDADWFPWPRRRLDAPPEREASTPCLHLGSQLLQSIDGPGRLPLPHGESAQSDEDVCQINPGRQRLEHGARLLEGIGRVFEEPPGRLEIALSAGNESLR